MPQNQDTQTPPPPPGAHKPQKNAAVQPGTPWWKLLAMNRPVLRLSLAMNFRHDYHKAMAAGRNHPAPGNRTRGYHLFNLMVHLAAAVALLGVVVRTLLTDRLRERFARAALPLALVVALLWVVHPLTTGAVTYVVQRAESMTGLFLLLTLYCAILALSARRRGAAALWIVLATAACTLGMGTKEVMVVAPLIVLAWDLIFSPKPLAARLGRRLGLYIPLACTYAVLIWGRLHATGGGGAGIGAKGVPSPWAYAWTQFGVILHYLKLSFWPVNQCLDYVWPTPGFWAGIGPMLVVLALLAGTVVALWRRPAVGFVGLWFFLILAPSSTFLPIKDAIFEHRMYLSLAAVVALIVCGGYWLGGALVARAKGKAPRSRRRTDIAAATWVLAACGVSMSLAAALALGVLTRRRNAVYDTEANVWRDVLKQYPDKPRANNNLGKALFAEGEAMRGRGEDGWLARMMEGMPYYRRAAELDADYVDPHYNLGVLYGTSGRNAEAIQEYEKCLAMRPGHTSAMNNLGSCYDQQGRTDKALEMFDGVLELQPLHTLAAMNKARLLRKLNRRDEAVQVLRNMMKSLKERAGTRPDTYATLHAELGDALAESGKEQEAYEAYRKAVEADDESWLAHRKLGLYLVGVNPAEAAKHLGKCLEKAPDDVRVRLALAGCQRRTGRLDQAVAGCRAVIEDHPGHAEAYLELGIALRKKNDIPGANTALSKFLDLKPDSARGYNEMGKLLQQAGNLTAARDYYSKAVARNPDVRVPANRVVVAEAHNNLGVLYYRLGRGDLAVPHYNTAVKLNPRDPVALNNLARLRATWPDPAVRNGEQARRIAEELCKATGNANPEYLSTLAAAYAELGRYEDAKLTAGRGAAIAMERENAALAKRLEAEMALYKTGRPLRERPRG